MRLVTINNKIKYELVNLASKPLVNLIIYIFAKMPRLFELRSACHIQREYSNLTQCLLNSCSVLSASLKKKVWS